jgi:hypothetical protein
MKKASEYRRHASECRQLANRMDVGEHRDQLLEMAGAWDKLAQERLERSDKAARQGTPRDPQTRTFASDTDE